MHSDPNTQRNICEKKTWEKT